MSDFEDELREVVEEAVGNEDEKSHVEHLPDNIGPNFRVAIAPNGYIWLSLGFDVVSTQSYCDSSVARAMARMLNEAADEHDRIVQELENRTALEGAANVIEFPVAEDEDGEVSEINIESADGESAVEEAAEHQEAVEDAVVAEAEGFN